MPRSNQKKRPLSVANAATGAAKTGSKATSQLARVAKLERDATNRFNPFVPKVPSHAESTVQPPVESTVEIGPDWLRVNGQFLVTCYLNAPFYVHVDLASDAPFPCSGPIYNVGQGSAYTGMDLKIINFVARRRLRDAVSEAGLAKMIGSDKYQSLFGSINALVQSGWSYETLKAIPQRGQRAGGCPGVSGAEAMATDGGIDSDRTLVDEDEDDYAYSGHSEQQQGTSLSPASNEAFDNALERVRILFTNAQRTAEDNATLIRRELAAAQENLAHTLVRVQELETQATERQTSAVTLQEQLALTTNTTEQQQQQLANVQREFKNAQEELSSTKNKLQLEADDVTRLKTMNTELQARMEQQRVGGTAMLDQVGKYKIALRRCADRLSQLQENATQCATSTNSGVEGLVTSANLLKRQAPANDTTDEILAEIQQIEGEVVPVLGLGPSTSRNSQPVDRRQAWGIEPQDEVVHTALDFQVAPNTEEDTTMELVNVRGSVDENSQFSHSHVTGHHTAGPARVDRSAARRAGAKGGWRSVYFL